MSKFMDEKFPTFKKFFAVPGKIKKLLRIIFLTIVLIAAVIIVKDQVEYTFGLGYWADDSGFYDDGLFGDEYSEDDAGYCLAGENVQGVILSGTLTTYIPDPYFNDPTLLEDSLTASESIVAQIKSADKNEKIKAIILEIDCYGGEATAAKEIADTLKRSQKPTVALIRGYGDSACYWAATGADAIFANTTSDVGNIGVTMSYLDYSNQNLKEGLTYQQISSGKFKDAGDPDKVLSVEEKELLQRDVDILHDLFVSEVATNRNLDKQEVEKLADGSSMLGQMALEAGLIDYLGDQFTVEEYLKEKLGEEVSICW